MIRPGADTFQIYLDKLHLHWYLLKYSYGYLDTWFMNVSRQVTATLQMYLYTFTDIFVCAKTWQE